jgi:negative regulator of sigma E activity
MKTLSSKGKRVSQKLELKWSKPMVMVKFLKPNVVQLAVAESVVLATKAHVSQIKKYYLSVG